MTHPDQRVTPVILDVTEPANNAGISLPDDLSGRDSMDSHLAVNLHGTWTVTKAFLPALTRAHGAIVNLVSLAAFAAVPVLPTYAGDAKAFERQNAALLQPGASRAGRPA